MQYLAGGDMGGWEKWEEMTVIVCDERMPTGLKVAVYKTIIRE